VDYTGVICVCMLHILNTVRTRNNVISADESFMVCHFQRGEQFQLCGSVLNSVFNCRQQEDTQKTCKIM
jgi:hypothetical protein